MKTCLKINGLALNSLRKLLEIKMIINLKLLLTIWIDQLLKKKYTLIKIIQKYIKVSNHLGQ